MRVKIRYRRMAGNGRMLEQTAPLISGVGGLLTLAWVSCLMLALWRLTSDLGWTDSFVISEGFLSHWQVWLGLTILFGLAGLRLNRHARTATGDGEFARAEAVAPVADDEVGSGDLVGPRVP